MSKFDALFPVRDMELAGERLSLRPFTFGQLPVVVGVIGNIFDELMGLDLNGLQIGSDGGVKADPVFIRSVAAFFACHAKEVVSILALSTGWEEEDVEALPPDLGLNLCVAVFSVNKDFFTERLSEALKAAMASPVAVAKEKKSRKG